MLGLALVYMVISTCLLGKGYIIAWPITDPDCIHKKIKSLSYIKNYQSGTKQIMPKVFMRHLLENMSNREA